ncbi:MAG TPA: hypothetical protein VLI54_01705 [Bacillota bacterium]|nr:hypothetical protein [Bacillota bacterium]
MADGKVEVIIRSTRPARKPDMQPDLSQEMALAAEACKNPDIARYFAAAGVLITERTSPTGKTTLQEAEIPHAFTAIERLTALGSMNFRVHFGDVYADMHFFDEIQRPDQPGPLLATRGVHAAHDLIAHGIPGWGLLPPQTLDPMAASTTAALSKGADPSRLLYRYDQAISIAAMVTMYWKRLNRNSLTEEAKTSTGRLHQQP